MLLWISVHRLNVATNENILVPLNSDSIEDRRGFWRGSGLAATFIQNNGFTSARPRWSDDFTRGGTSRRGRKASRRQRRVALVKKREEEGHGGRLVNRDCPRRRCDENLCCLRCRFPGPLSIIVREDPPPERCEHTFRNDNLLSYYYTALSAAHLSEERGEEGRRRIDSPLPDQGSLLPLRKCKVADSLSGRSSTTPRRLPDKRSLRPAREKESWPRHKCTCHRD